jgi:hypothetical protein
VQVAVAVGVLPAVVGIAWNYAPPPTPTFPVSEILSFRLLPPSPLRTVDSGEPGPDAEYGILQAEPLRRVEKMPEVSSVTFLAEGARGYIEVEDPIGATESNVRLTGSVPVDVEYFTAFGVPLLAGRTFDRDDAVEGATAAIVNRAFVDEYFAGGAALGRRFREMTPGADEGSEAGPWFEVVGVIENMLRPSGRGRRASPRAYHAMALGTEPLELAARRRGIDAAGIERLSDSSSSRQWRG